MATFVRFPKIHPIVKILMNDTFFPRENLRVLCNRVTILIDVKDFTIDRSTADEKGRTTLKQR